MKKVSKRLIFVWILIAVVFLIWGIGGNRALITTHYTTESAKIPPAFDGFRIVQISDLHNTEFGDGNKKLLALLADSQPDMIVITGDLVDSRKADPEVAIAFVREAAKIAPVYYVPGNHEARIPEVYEVLKTALSDLGVVVLENESRILEKDGQTITVTGLLDPDFGVPWQNLVAESYQIVLSHRPEQFEFYTRQGFDLVFTGHAHGGQFRLPFIGGLIAPHQGFFPEYTSGVHTKGDTSMVVSRGLGNSVFPLRFNNRPELILVTLESI